MKKLNSNLINKELLLTCLFFAIAILFTSCSKEKDSKVYIEKASYENCSRQAVRNNCTDRVVRHPLTGQYFYDRQCQNDYNTCLNNWK